MSLFETIKNKIFGSKPAEASTGFTTPSPALTQFAANPTEIPTTISEVDVSEIMTKLAEESATALHWKTSIVDMMKLLNMDSSLTARKELAGELGFSGDTNDSATMNIWLHSAVMKKLAENGGKVPAEMIKN